MFRTSLFLILVLPLLGFQTEFDSKQDAIDYLNNSNIWVAGMPEYKLDEANGMLNVTLSSKQGSVTANVPLKKIKTELVTGKLISVEMNCKSGSFCATANTNSTVAETDGLTLVMSSTFDDGNYEEKYLEQGAKIVDALDYLISFYAD